MIGSGKSLDEQPAVLVTGGAGFLGRHLTSQLAQSGVATVCMYHHRLPESHEKTYPFCSDLSTAELLAAPLRGVSTVIHLAWEGGLRGTFEGDGDPGKTRNLAQLGNLIRAMEKAGTTKLIFVSAIGAHRESPSHFLREKYFGEFQVLNSNIASRVVVRLPVLFGELDQNDRFLRSLRRVLRWPAIYPSPLPELRVAPMHVADAAKTVVELATNESNHPCEIREMYGPDAIRVGDLLRHLSNRFGSRGQLPVGGAVGRSLLKLLERDNKSECFPRASDVFSVWENQVIPAIDSSASTGLKGLASALAELAEGRVQA